MKLCLSMEALITLQEYKHGAHEKFPQLPQPTFFHIHSIMYESLLKEIDSIINHLAVLVQDLH